MTFLVSAFNASFISLFYIFVIYIYLIFSDLKWIRYVVIYDSSVKSVAPSVLVRGHREVSHVVIDMDLNICNI